MAHRRHESPAHRVDLLNSQLRLRRGITVLFVAVTGAVSITAGATPMSERPPRDSRNLRVPTSLSRLVGQAIMTGFSGERPNRDLLARIKSGQVGGVILFGSNIGDATSLRALIRQLQQAAADGHNPPLLIATDQEGGDVKRLPQGPPDLSPAAMGLLRSTSKAHAEGRATCRYLRSIGINVDLAPVLDTPNSPNNFLGTRAFSSEPFLNASLGSAFISGLQGCGVGATAKHFPGLGTATADTDSNHVLIESSRTELDARLKPFLTAIRDHVKLVMISNAGYAAYDPSGLPADLSAPIIRTLLRKELHFNGVTISDSMEAPGPSNHFSAATDAIRNGMDVLLYTQQADSQAAFQQVLAAATKSATIKSDIRVAAKRIIALKRWFNASP